MNCPLCHVPMQNDSQKSHIKHFYCRKSKEGCGLTVMFYQNDKIYYANFYSDPYKITIWYELNKSRINKSKTNNPTDDLWDEELLYTIAIPINFNSPEELRRKINLLLSFS